MGNSPTWTKRVLHALRPQMTSYRPSGAMSVGVEATKTMTATIAKNSTNWLAKWMVCRLCGTKPSKDWSQSRQWRGARRPSELPTPIWGSTSQKRRLLSLEVLSDFHLYLQLIVDHLQLSPSTIISTINCSYLQRILFFWGFGVFFIYFGICIYYTFPPAYF